MTDEGREVNDPGMLPLEARAQALEQMFVAIQQQRMAGVPLLNPRLHVEAVGFEADDEGEGALGVLVTPWFMNLVWMPLGPRPSGQAALGRGHKRPRTIGDHTFEFIGAHEEPFGSFEACSLFSPVLQFVDHEAAVATAREALALVRAPAPDGPVSAGGGSVDADAAGEPGNDGDAGEAGDADAAGGRAQRQTNRRSSPAAQPDAPPVRVRRSFLFGRGGAAQ